MRLYVGSSAINTDITAELKKQFYSFSEEYTVFGVFLYGSQNYGLATEDSDIDTKVVVIPSMDDLLFRKPVSKTVQTDCGLADVKDIRLYFNNLKKQNINFVETLFSDYGVYCNKHEMEKMFAMREDIAHFDEEKAIACMKGMYDQALKKYEVDRSNKQLANMVRLCVAMERYSNGQPYRKVIRVPNLLFMKTGGDGGKDFEHFKKATEADTKTFVETFSMDYQPRNEALDKEMDDLVRNIIFSRIYRS